MSPYRPTRPTNPEPPRFLQRLRARAQPQAIWRFDGRTAFWGLVGAIFALLLWLLAPILAPFLAAAILAYILDPLVRAMERRGLSRGSGTTVAVLLLILAVLLIFMIVLPLFYKESAQLIAQMPAFVDRLKTDFLPWLSLTFGIDLALDPASLKQLLSDNVQDPGGVAHKIFSSLSVGGLAVIGFLVNLLLVPVVLFYLLRDWPAVLRSVDRLIPRDLHARAHAIGGEIDRVLSEFLRGQLSVMLIMSVVYVTGLWLAGLQFALPVGLITGLLVFIPYIGSGTGIVLGTIAALMQFLPSMQGVIWVWVAFAVGQTLEGFIITPRLVGKRIGLHPVAVLFALLAFGQMFGFFGVLLALPASAALLVGLRHLSVGYRKSRMYGRD